VILVTRLNGPPFLLNPDLVERAEATPDTVVTLVGGTKYVVTESLDELSKLVLRHRAEVLALADEFANGSVLRPHLRVIPSEEH
jgi:flagellar protein FlbD